MKSNCEIRKQVSATLRNRWFWRLLVVIVVLNTLPQAVSRLLNWAFTENGIQTWQDFSTAWVTAVRSGLYYTVPSWRVALEMTGSSLFMSFIVYVFLAISIMGLAIASLKAVHNDSKNWFGESLSGFKRPLELAWFLVVINFRVCLWMLLFLIPGLIAIYRYRNGWYLKCEHWDWSVSKCLAESSRMMKGRKCRAFCLDLSYFWRMMVAMVLWGGLSFAGLTAGNLILRTVLGIAGFMALGWLLLLVVGITVARAQFYQELKAECSAKSSESLA